MGPAAEFNTDNGPPPAREPLKRLAWEKSLAAVRQAIEHSTPETLAAVVGGPSDAHSILTLLPRDLTPAPPERAVAEHKARLRTKAFRDRLTEQSEGMFNRNEVAQHLGISAGAVDKQRQRRQILGVPFGPDFGYPRIQFLAEGPVPGLRTILEAFGDMQPWVQLQMLHTPLTGYADEPRSIIQLLRDGVDEKTLGKLRGLAVSWAA